MDASGVQIIDWDHDRRPRRGNLRYDRRRVQLSIEYGGGLRRPSPLTSCDDPGLIGMPLASGSKVYHYLK